ncbi:fused DSP-PTPase phosphatase/NAD kinase-like protein [Nioella aestuarii]|uniref:fused DSP-PTPase phosphatase/NAD kinase-like protein n=1 Tax=Nioella aestuarii TaxID=1662864 RepID=UPI003D7FB86A
MITALKTALRNRRDRRHAALAEWRAGWSADLDAPGARKAARYDMNILDHGIIRKLWTNRFEIAPGVWRSNQPSPEQIADLAQMGIRTILNFRGVSHWGSYLLETEACAASGITLVNGRLYSSAAPTKQDIHTALMLMDAAEKPMLMHCKSGADRAGLASVLYLLARGTEPEIAARQLSWKYAHLRVSRTGILDAFVDAYAEDRQKTGISFLDWVDTVYDPEALTARFTEARGGNRMLDWILRRE